MEKKTKIDLLAIQIGSEVGRFEANLKKVEFFLEKCLSQRNADFVFLPEVWTVGWDCPSFIELSEQIDLSHSVNLLKKIARKYRVNIIGGSFIERKQDNVFANTCPVINREGDLVCTYEKNHLYSYYGSDEGKYITAGKNPVLVELEGVKFGLSICYDIRFPELYRAYRIAGADILVNMAAWGANKKIPWDSMNTSRAVENQCFHVALTQTGKIRGGENLGHSMILDYKGDILSEIEKVEGGIYASIDLKEMYEFREKCKVINDIKDSYEVMIK